MIRRLTLDGDTMRNVNLPLAGAPPLELSAGRQAMRIEYTIPRFDNHERNQHQVRMLGLSEEWSPWSRETYRDYTNLPPGRYRFEVRGRDVHGLVSEPASLDFVLKPPWYESAWAVLIYAIAGASLLAAFINWRTQQSRRRSRELEKLVQKRTAELQRHRLMLAEAERIANIGSREHEPESGRFVWSTQLYHILGFDPEHGAPDKETRLSIFHPDDRDVFRRFEKKSIETGMPYELELRVQRPDGRDSMEKAREMIEIAYREGHNRFEWMHVKRSAEQCPVEVNLSTFTVRGGAMLMVVMHDLTERLREEQRRRRMRELETVNRLAATLSHEFNTPLAVIRIAAEMLALRLDDDPDVRSNLNKIITHVGRIRELVDKMHRLRELREIDYAIGMKILDIHEPPEAERANPGQSGEGGTDPGGTTARPSDSPPERGSE
ncbi:MAG: hypothetical protein MAG453_01063 [Calditrichaeota bacterium]|nr:hypothetical protein [Calditrichota bacterium]